MAQAPSPAAVVLPRRAYRIVLFGMPEAGKSSLLGALAQAAQLQEHALGAKLIDRTHGLMELQRRLYEDRPRETLEEVLPYPVVLEPFPTKDGQPPLPAAEAVLFDCDGRVANELLARRDALTGDLGRRALAQAVLGADTLVLCLDVSADSLRLKRDFAQFARFLRVLERSRGQRAEIGGFPVYLVLTKCDLLAGPTDISAAWMDHIEERKRAVHQKFQEFLAEQAAREQMAFGKINLHVWATAVKRPALVDAPPRPKEPYGVAELFRQCVESAQAFRQRRQQATQRLGVMLGVLGGLVAFMVVLALFFLATHRESEMSHFEREIRDFRTAHSETPADRLRQPRETLKQLRSMQQNPLFDKMPEELRQYVNGHGKELDAYEHYVGTFDKYLQSKKLPSAPRFADNERQLEEMAEALKRYPVPEEYRSAWETTEPVRREREWRGEIEVMRREVRLASEKFDTLLKLGRDYLDYPITGTIKGQQDLLLNIKVVLGNFPLVNSSPEARIPGSFVTYGNVQHFQGVDRRFAAWKEMRKKLPPVDSE